jgi:branched-chain amino acid transport system permease protein
MQLLLQRLFDGLTLGVLYAVVAVALVLIFKATSLINFAQGELAMFGAFIAYVLAVEQGLPIGVAIVVAMAISAALGAAIERVLLRPFDPSDNLPVVLITLGLFLVLNAVAGEIWNYQPRAFPSLFPKGPDDFVSIGGARLFYDAVGTWAMLGAMMAALYLVLNKTKVGLAFRAVSSSPDSARLVGIRTGRTLMFGWALACAFGTLGASLVAPRLFIQPNMMAALLIFSFASAALGGLDSLPGAVVGGIIVGLVQSLVVGYLADWEPLSFLRNLGLAVAFVVILVVLLLKPSGMFGTSRVERV